MPWTPDDRLDRGALRRTVARCAETGSHGIYVAGTTGEFHAMSETQFADVVETYAAAMRDHPQLGVQVGCGGFSLRQVLDRVSIVDASGLSNIQLPLPGWEPLNDAEVLAFFSAIVDRFPDVDICVYDNPASGRVIGAELWQQLVTAVPAVSGAKFIGLNPDLAQSIRGANPTFNFLGTEENIVDLWPHGVRSIAAWISYAFPAVLNELWQALGNGDASTFAVVAQKMDIISERLKEPMRPMGYRGGLIDRLMGLGSGFLEPVYGRVLPPWQSIDPQHVKRVRDNIAAHLGGDYLYG